MAKRNHSQDSDKRDDRHIRNSSTIRERSSDHSRDREAKKPKRSDSTANDKKKRESSTEKAIIKTSQIQFNEKEYYYNEQFDESTWLENWNQIIDKIKDCKMQIKNETSTEKREHIIKIMLIAILNLRKQNRKIQYQLRKSREQIKLVSEKCDQEDVLLQNVIYEQKHLFMAANSCLQFKSRHCNFDSLATPQDVYADQIENKNLPENSHAMTIARLELELKNRQNFDKKLSTNEHNLEEKKKLIDLKEKKIQNAESQLDKIIQVADPLCSTFGLDINFVQKVNKTASKCDKNLAHLYKQVASSIEDAEFEFIKEVKVGVEENGQVVCISGQVPFKNKAFFMKFKVFNDGADKDQMAGNFNSTKSRRLGISLSQNYVKPVIKVSSSLPFITGSLFLESEKYGLIDDTPISDSSFVEYKWVNEICGISETINLPDMAAPQNLINQIDLAIGLNVKNLQTIGSFLKNKKFAPINNEMKAKFKKCSPYAKIYRFEELSYDKYKGLSLSNKVVAQGLALPSQKYFVGKIARCDEENFERVLNFTICMPYTHGVGALFSLEQDGKYTSKNKLALRLIECEINNNLKFNNNILADQIWYLAVLFDLLIEMEHINGNKDDSGDSAPTSNVIITKNFSYSTNAFMTNVPIYNPFSGIFDE